MFSIERSQWHKIKKMPTDIALWYELLGEYTSRNLTWQAIYVTKKIIQLDPREKSALDAMVGWLDWESVGAGDAILQHASLDGAEEQIERFANWIKDNPTDWLTWQYLARLCDLLPTKDNALQTVAIERAESFEYIKGESAHLLGFWRSKAGDFSGALTALAPLVNVRPLRYGSMMYLGEVLLRLGQIDAAKIAFSRASHSKNPKFLALLASIVYQNNYWQEAIEILGKATALAPQDASLWMKLARIQSQVYLLPECRESLARIQEIAPNDEAKLLEIGLIRQAGDAQRYFNNLQSFNKTVPQSNLRMISSVLMMALYQDDMQPEEIATLHQSMCSQLDRNEGLNLMPVQEHCSEKETLRVGYVTGDLHRQHPVNIFMLPLLEEQKKSSIEIFIYHAGSMYDMYTERARNCADRWLEVLDWDDGQLHKQILQDQIDVLIDLAGHTSTNRLGVFLNRSAPVQVTFLGYPHSTGLDCIDYLIGDSVVSPFEHQPLFSEKIVQLENSVFCWRPVDDYSIASLERSNSSPVVFGSFNNALKLTPKTIALWSRVLKAVPGSQLLLKAPSFKCSEACDRIKAVFEYNGISAERLQLRGPSELGQMMQEYGDVDIALDPLTYNGGTTSLQALWMGVPLITLEGGNFVSRMGSSFLQTLGNPEWIAKDEEGYVEIAQSIAKSIGSVRNGRVALREQMSNSALCDIKKYAQNFEVVLHEIFQVSRKALVQ